MLYSDIFDLDQSGSQVIAHIERPQVTHLDMQDLVEECLERMRCHNATHFIIDLEKVEFLASACIGPLVSLVRDLEHVRGRVALANCQDNVAFVFRVTRLDSIFEMYDSIEDAKDAM